MDFMCAKETTKFYDYCGKLMWHDPHPRTGRSPRARRREELVEDTHLRARCVALVS
jgi:hypothetical protein